VDVTEAVVPSYDVLMWPTIRALKELGGSGAISEVNEKIIDLSDFSTEQQAVLHGDGPQTEIEYRLAWARTYLKFAGLAENSSRGVWTLTEHGRSADEPTTRRLHVAARRERHLKRMQHRRESPAPPGYDEEPGDDDGLDWRDELLELVMKMRPDARHRGVPACA
jgi:restriction system protein